MSTIKTKKVQVGTDSTASNNFTIYTPGTPDGTVRIGNGNADSPTDRVTVKSDGKVGIGTSSPGYMLDVVNTSLNPYINVYGSTTSDAGILLGDSSEPYKAQIKYQNSSDSLAFATNNGSNVAMRMDSNGYVTTPNNVRFYGNTFSNVTQTSGGVIPICTNIVHNTNSWYNTTTGVFTAPVSGVYQFSWAYLLQNITDTANIDGGFLLNGIFIFGGSRYVASEAGYGGYVSEKFSVTPYLSENDTFSPRVGIANDTSWNFYQNSTWGFLSGCLIG